MHLHADVKVYINGQQINFSQSKYQLRNSFVHFEDGNGEVAHVHAAGLTVGYMLKSLGIDFNSNCIIVESESYCSEKDKKLKFYINNKINKEFDKYIIKDVDKILVSYGNES